MERGSRASWSPAYEGPEDAFTATCAVCGDRGRFRRDRRSIAASFPCPSCGAVLRYQGQARVLVSRYARHGATSLAELVREPEFRLMRIWEPGRLGPFRRYLRRLGGYQESRYWPDVEPGETRGGVRCEDLMAPTFASDSFDLVITTDVFEHVRKPYLGLAEVFRVLRPGGVHVFTVPARWPMRSQTRVRVDTSGDEDAFLLDPAYHGNSLVYHDFGLDMLGRLADIGFETEPVVFDSSSPGASQHVTFRATKPAGADTGARATAATPTTWSRSAVVLRGRGLARRTRARSRSLLRPVGQVIRR